MLGGPTTAGRAADGLAAGTARRLLGLVAVSALLVVVALLSLLVGWAPVPVGVVVSALTTNDGSFEHAVVAESRVPRMLVGLAVGAAFGVAGALIQAVTRNPLGDSGILGVDSGAAFVVAGGLVLLGPMSINRYVWFALLGALLATLAVYAIGSAGRGGPNPVRLLLAGVALGAVLDGIVTALTLMAPSVFDRMRFWNAGSVAGRPLADLAGVVPVLLVGMVLALVVARPLNAIALGDDMAAAIGARVARTRMLGIAGITLLAGGATALAGPIGFVGLMAPHIVRWFVGPDQRWILAYSLPVAAGLVVVADTLGRVILSTGELPVGIVVTFLGAPVLIALVRRRRVSGL